MQTFVKKLRFLQPGRPSYQMEASNCWQWGWATNWKKKNIGLIFHNSSGVSEGVLHKMFFFQMNGIKLPSTERWTDFRWNYFVYLRHCLLLIGIFVRSIWLEWLATLFNFHQFLIWCLIATTSNAQELHSRQHETFSLLLSWQEMDLKTPLACNTQGWILSQNMKEKGRKGLKSRDNIRSMQRFFLRGITHVSCLAASSNSSHLPSYNLSTKMLIKKAMMKATLRLVRLWCQMQWKKTLKRFLRSPGYIALSFCFDHGRTPTIQMPFPKLHKK